MHNILPSNKMITITNNELINRRETMNKFISLFRMWLTRSRKPFIFTNNNDEKLTFSDCNNLGLYVHIPFCSSICNYCPYCKTLYVKETCDKYINHLIKEIEMVSNDKDKQIVTSLYFGGGTPALARDRLGEIIETIKKYYIITEGIGVELHPNNVDVHTLTALKKAGVTKISIGIQSFQDKYQNILGRSKMDTKSLFEAIRVVPFETVSMDFIFALPNQTFDDLKNDIDMAFENGANHIAIYPFIDFTFTSSNVKSMPKKDKRYLLDEITNYCLNRGYTRDSIWTFSNDENAKYSSMTRDCFLGFGCSATTLLKTQFKINTFSVDAYCEEIDKGSLPSSLTIRFSKRQRMVYYLFWSAYSTKVDCRDFEEFFGEPLKKYYGLELAIMKILGFITERDGIFKMTLKGAFYYHHFENFYTLSYIDKMWGIMRKEAFPEKIEL